MNGRDQYMAYMRGWRDGAGLRAMRTELVCHDNAAISEAYGKGYSDGRGAAGVASSSATFWYGYKPSILRLQEEK